MSVKSSGKPWSKMPTEWIDNEIIRTFQWQDDGSTGTAALIIFFTLCHHATSHTPSISTEPLTVARLSYDAINDLSGLSRKLISKGLARLEEAEMISRLGPGYSGGYEILGLERGQRWAKLPCRALLSGAGTSFKPFSNFTLRSLHELNAMKLYLYYVGIRDSKRPYSAARYETINNRLCIPERNIPRANSFLLAAGLLHRIERRVDPGEDQPYGPNQYFMEGYKDIFKPTT